jgi:uncharacterized LabA/DUF88 family protein
MSELAENEARTVALYWDFENIHASLCEAREPGSYGRPDTRFRPQEPLVNIQAVVDFAASFGPIAINRAYGNWQFYGRYRDALLQNAVELIQLFPPGGAAKNGADIKLCLDATEDIGRFHHIGVVIIVGGDSDFMPVSQKIKAAGRTLVGIGTRRSTNRHWAKSCHEFRYYDSLIEVREEIGAVQEPVLPIVVSQASAVAEEAPTAAVEAPSPREPEADALDSDPGELLRRALRLLAEKRADRWVNKAEIWPMIKRLDPTFDLAEHGYTSFSNMLKAWKDLVEIRKGQNDQQVCLVERIEP